MTDSVKPSENIIGLIAFQGHGSSAALVRNGNLVGAVSEERFSRQKDDNAFPRSSIESLLTSQGLRIQEIDKIFFAWNPYKSVWAQLERTVTGKANIDFIFKQRHTSDNLSRFDKFFKMASIRSQIENEFRFAPKLIFSDHHYCHSISALAQSGFENALSIVMDGSGERDAITVYLVRERKHKKVLSVPFPHSLGCFFAAVTQYLGFQPDSDEFKVMGLSAWGKPNQVEVFRKMMGSENVFSLDLSYFAHHKDADQFYSARFETEFGKYEDLSFQEKSDIAASAQVILNENVIRIIRTALEIAASGVDEICFSGGVFQNCILNQNIREIFPNKKLFFSPISSDLGSAVGAAFSQSYQSGEKLNFPGLYLGPSYDDQIILKYLEENRLVFRKCEDPSLEAAKLISQGHIIGWFQGSAEFGPRALGNRSILANPRVKGIKDKINKMIKQREAFRPFAPSVLYEKRQELFECEHFAPFMIETVNTIAGKRDLVAEAIHVDGTARVQTVTNELNPHYYRLIQEFYRITGQPAVLNTSFNRNTEPIVNSPADAISCFKEAGLDFLVIGDYIVKHSDNFRI